MKTIAIICEYNPFHRGHQKQFRLIREEYGQDAAIVCLMSGNFVQRGEPALYPRMIRAKAAILGGADLVLELPVTYSLRSAEGFAGGGVEILSGLGAVDGLSFGCERTEGIRETAALLLSDAFPAVLREQLDHGVSFAAARQRALESLGADGSLIASPNNILAVEYCKNILLQKSSLEPMPLVRQGSYHDNGGELDPENPSAERLRRMPNFYDCLPEETVSCYDGEAQYRMSYGERAMLARLRTIPESEFSKVPFGSEGLWRKVMALCHREASVEAILTGAKSKRYAYTRLSRLLICAYLGISEAQLAESVPYVRVLGLRARGREILRTAREQGSITLLHAGEKAPQSEYAELEHRCGLLYDLFRQDVPAGLQKEKLFYYDEKRG